LEKRDNAGAYVNGVYFIRILAEKNPSAAKRIALQNDSKNNH